jgi:predicted ATPase/transcriptional regulator with XRE-family HTH domain
MVSITPIKQPARSPLGVVIAPITTPKYATIWIKMIEDKNAPVVFGQWLKLRRKALDMTQDELAKRVGCSIGALRKIEAGDRKPSRQLAGLLAKAIKISDDDQQAFIHVARGDLNFERLGLPAADTPADFLAGLLNHQARVSSSPKVEPDLPVCRIPLQTTPMIGRENEYAALEKFLGDEKCRLLVLTGIGGIGKTRLAIEYALKSQSAFPGGVFYFPLTSVKTPEDVIPAIAEIIDYVFSGPATPKEQLLNYISISIKQRALFIFDNLEHLLSPISTEAEKPGLVELVCEILEHLPNVTILGTSRERLNVHGEWTYELHGLSIPPTDFIGQLENYDSVALFLNNARRLRTTFQLPVEEQPYLVHICQMLDGVPLAIELAAAWVGLLTCREIAREIKSNMDFLTTSMRNIPERHRSIRATFDHSWKLLSEEERQVLCQLSVFYGGFDRKAASQIAGASLPLLASLCDKSLVSNTGNGRYDLHEVIRQYASSHLDNQPDYQKVYARHCEYYLAFVESHEKALKSALQQEAMRQLSAEIDNIRAAWAWAIDYGKFTQLGQAGRAYGWYFEIAGLLNDGIEQLELLKHALEEKSMDDQWQRTMGLALIHQALLTFRKGEFDHARELYQKSIEILRPAKDKALLADGLVYLGIILHLSGKYEQAKSAVEKGLIFARECNDRWVEAYAIYNLGYLDSLQGNYSAGYRQMMDGLSMWREIGDPFSIALGLNFLVSTLIELNRYEEAHASMVESIALCEKAKNRWGMGTAYRYMGLVKMAAGQLNEAEADFRKSLEIFGDYTIGWDIAQSLTYLGDISRMSGDFHEARRNYLDALQHSIEAKATPIALYALGGLSRLQAQAGKVESSLMLCYYILNHSSSEDVTKIGIKQQCAALESSFSNEQITSIRYNATRRTFEEILEIASET